MESKKLKKVYHNILSNFPDGVLGWVNSINQAFEFKLKKLKYKFEMAGVEQKKKKKQENLGIPSYVMSSTLFLRNSCVASKDFIVKII